MKAMKLKQISDRVRLAVTGYQICMQTGSAAEESAGVAKAAEAEAANMAEDAAATTYRHKKLGGLFAMSQLDLDASVDRYATPNDFPRN